MINKDRSLAPSLIEGILKYWPTASSDKELGFI